MEKDKKLNNLINAVGYHYLDAREPWDIDVKREELLLILLQAQPGLAGLFFDYRIPEKINIGEFINRNYQFNVSLDRFAYLTGRSLSAFKRDFKQVFGDTAGRSLVQRRLREAYFLISQQHQKPVMIYLKLAFETLPHFSYAFKKQFWFAPSELMVQKRQRGAFLK